MSNINNNTTNLENILDTIEDISGSPILLWTNASPTSDFVAQTIGVNGAGYDAYIIEFYPNGKGSFPNGGTVVYIEKGRTDQIMIGQADSNFQWNRSITSVTDTGIAFSKASGSRCYQYHCVPVHIWGVKFTL